MKKLFTRFGIFALVIVLMFNVCAGAFAATTSNEITQRENESSEFAYYAATQGMALLENNGALPIAKTGKVALFGSGARHTVKGGTGSGDVNQRAIVTVEQGFENAGYTVTSKAYLDAYQVKYQAEYTGGGMSAPPPIDDLADIDAYIEAAKGADYAFYVIARNSGEFADRTNSKLDYELSDNERANIEKIAKAFDKTIIVLNVGGVMDTKFFKEIKELDAMLLMSQAGMRGGDAVVAVLNGTVNPSGKLTDTWPVNYSDYACADEFGSNDNDVNHEYYKDDIYVGYRYFDTFGKAVAYPFGYGMSYTDFDIDIYSVGIEGTNVAATVTVTNKGAVAGKEVVQVYFSAPDGALEKPYQELGAYAKTKELAPGASQSLKITFPISEMSSYSMDKAAYILEKGDYIIRIGNSSRNTAVGGVLTLAEDKITEQLSNQMVQDEPMEVYSKKGQTPITYEGEAAQIAAAKRVAIDPATITTANNASKYDAEEITSYVYPGSDYVKAEGTRYTKGPSGNPTVKAVKVFDAADGKETIEVLERPEGLEAGKYTLRDVATNKITMTQFVADLSVEEMAYIVEGIGWGGASSPIIGAQGNTVQGSAGETTARYYETRLIPNTVLADGPAGIRITQQYNKNDTTYYQFASAFPIGTLIAMTWDPEVIRGFGDRIGTEMTEFGVTLWLAPGMNIHRNALCGRNFEYYSEDPLIAGLTAGYTTLGVQSHAGIGVTLKHYSGNNQENNRNAVNNTITERAIREIYLKGFEIAVKMAQPMAIMTSYNQNNSMPAADDYDMCTDIPRGEWNYHGLIMTDWGGGQSQPVNSMHAGNDLIMPGGSSTSIIDQFGDNAPTLDPATGYVTKSQSWWGATENWGEFTLAADGTSEISVTVAASVDVAGSTDIQSKVAAGTASVKENADGTKTITYKGNYGANSLPLGDLQKSAANVLNIIMKSTQFQKITTEYEGQVVRVQPYSNLYSRELKTYMANTTVELPSEREKANSDFSCYAATQGMALLENNGVLPIAKSGKVALFGAGVRSTVKGGTGSGAVNQRDTVNVEQGFENAGYTVTTKDYLDAYAAKPGGGGGGGMWGSNATKDDLDDIDAYIESAKAAGSEYAFYFVARNSGEGSDRKADKLDYLLSDNELANIKKIAAAFDKTIVVLNTGGVMDTKFYKEAEGLDAMLLMSQAGMRGGDAVVQVLNGTVNPSGKLTDTWPLNYSDYPSAETFANNDNDNKHEIYDDDIYVGYRYFDTFGKEVSYPFGYGLSYTTFDIKTDAVLVNGENVILTATVTNTGKVAGKEVVEVYFSAPKGALEKPYQELVAFGKTGEIEPGASEKLAITFPVSEMSSYSMEKAAYILEKGEYVIRVGNSSRNTAVGAVLTLAEDKITEQLSNQMVQDQELELLSSKDATPITYPGEADQIKAAKRISIEAGGIATLNNASPYDEEKITSYVYPGSDYKKAEGERYTKGASGNSTVQAVKVFDAADGKETIETLTRPEGLEPGKYTLYDVASGKITMEQFVADLTVDEMAHIVEGISGASNPEPTIGAAANSVQGAAGETTSLYYATRLIPNTVLADGPAGVRITQHYTRNGEDYYQYCTAFPIGTLIAMTWDPKIIYEFGNRIGQEMEEYGVTLWLAPGMNIHRNALCGRNFEYYSEDPLIAGITAGYTTLGVQSHPGVGVTLKHYALNSQETNRNSENNSVTERAVREIYLKGFEIAVKMAQPMAIMTSYNQNNSMPAADDYDLCTDIPRGEWGFKGLIMTDWGGGQSTPVNSMHAGNDLIMPGGSTASIINQFRDIEPTFDPTTGYVTNTGGRRPTDNWGTFSLNANGSKELSVTVAASVDPMATAKVASAVEAGTASITENADGTKTVTYKGDYAKHSLPLGDLQKAAMHVLNIIMQSSQFQKITKEYKEAGEAIEVIIAEPYSLKYAADLQNVMDSMTNRFVDVPNDSWFAPYVLDVAGYGIMKGVDETHFSPDNNIKRGDFVLMLYRMAGEPDVSDLALKFTDVQRDYYKDAIKWASDSGIVKGTSDTTFSPEKSITREQIATILYRWVGEPAVEDKLAGFEDGAAVSDYAKAAMNWAIANGVITGSKDTATGKVLLKPQASATRAQIAAIIDRSLPLLAG